MKKGRSLSAPALFQTVAPENQSPLTKNSIVQLKTVLVNHRLKTL